MAPSTRPSTTSSLLLLVLSAAPGLVSADYEHREMPPEKEGEFTRFRTRPDLRVPVLDFKIHDAERLAPGHWFVSPYENVHPAKDDSPPWVTPCIYDAQGDLLWTAGDMFHHRNTQDFRASEVLGETFLSMIYQDDGVGLMLDDHFEKRYETHIGVNMETLNIHDWNVVDNGTRVLNFKKYFHIAPREQTDKLGFDEDCHVEYQMFFERDIANNFEPVFTWNGYDHIPVDDSTYLTDLMDKNGCRKGHWDYWHANSVDKCPDGEYVLSARHSDTIYKIGRDGQVVWRLGGPKDDFSHDFKFSRQHDVRCLAQNETHTTISFLDNAVGFDYQPATHDWSRGLIIAIDDRLDSMHATLTNYYDHPQHKLSDGRGGMQVLPNGNVVMGWSAGGGQSEYAANGDLLMEGQFVPDYLRTYRTYKFPFVGRPLTKPDVLSEVVKVNKKYKTDVYMSWNGATEVQYWNLYKSDHTGKSMFLHSTTNRQGFETKMTMETFSSFVIVEALDANRRPLGRSEVIQTNKLEHMPESVLASEREWLQNPTADPWGDAVGAFWAVPHSVAAFYMFLGFLLASSIGGTIWFVRRLRRGRISAPWQSRQLYELVGDRSEKYDDAADGSDELADGNGRFRKSARGLQSP